MIKKNEEQLKRELPFDLYGRYAVIRDIINANRQESGRCRVLDVGGRGNLMRRFLPKDVVFYLDPYVDTKDENFIKGDGCEMPLEDESFDWVVSADVFEHIPKRKRKSFLKENIRVAKRGVILVAPFHSSEVNQAEININENHKILSGGKEYAWLKEHFKNGLPKEKDLEDYMKAHGFDFQKLYNNRLFFWQTLVGMELIAFNNIFLEEIKKELENFNLFYNKEVYPHDLADPLSYRKIYFIKKDIRLKSLKVSQKKNDDELFLKAVKRGINLLSKIDALHRSQIREGSLAFQQKQTDLIELNDKKIKMEETISRLKETIARKEKEEELLRLANQRKIKMEETTFRLKETISQKEKEIYQKDQEIDFMKSSRFWKLREWNFKIKFAIFHPLLFAKKYSKKIKKTADAAYITYEKEGLVNAAKRSKNYLLHGKGILEKEEKKTAEVSVEKRDIYCLTEGGVKDADILKRIENFLKGSKEEIILLISHDASTTGAPILISHMAKVLSKNFNEKIIVLTLKGGPLESEYAKFGLVINLNQAILNSLEKIGEINSIFRTLRKSGVEKCICNSVVSGMLVPFLERYHFDYTNLIHEQANTIRSCGFIDALNNILKYSKKIVFSSEFVRNEFIEAFGQKLKDAIICPQGLYHRNRLSNSKELAREILRRKLGLSENSKIVLACGFADVRKGFDLFYEVVRKINEMEEKGIEFVWLGDRDKELSKKLNDIAINKGFADKINLCDFEKDPSVFFAGADVFLLTSREDPFPTVALLALDCGIPVIAFENSGGMPELLLKNSTGIVVPYLDANAMARELIGLLKNKQARETISKKAREIVESNFDFGEYAKFLLSLFSNKSDSKYSKAAGAGLKVSVVVPNYNYEKFLDERLYSIINQTHKPYEIIFLDDASHDNSVALAENFLSKTDVPYKIIKNKSNVGCFKQWARGVREAVGDLIWIAEADDSCEPEFLESLAEKFGDPEVGLAYSQSTRIDELGGRGETYLSYPESIPGAGDRWRKNYANSGADEISKYLLIKNTIVNASAVLMRRSLLSEIGENLGAGLSQAGDWITYIQILQKSKIAFVAEPLNFHRFHGKNIVSRSGANSEGKARQLIDETIHVHDYIFSNFEVSRRRCALALEHLKLVFRNNFGKEIESFPEYSERLEIYKKAAEKSQKRILFFSTNDGWGGSEVACVKMAQSFSAAGWRVALVMNKHTPRPEILNSIVSDRPIEFFERGPGDYCRSDETAEFVNNFDADIIYISQGHTFEAADLMKWCNNNGFMYVNFIPLVTEYHLTFLNDKKDIEKNGRLLRKSKKIFLDNQNAQEVARKIFNIAFDNFQLIRNGFDVSYHQEFTWNEPENDVFKLAFIGRLEKVHKGLDMLLDVLSMKKWKEKPLKVMFYGHGPYEETIRRKMEKNNMENIVLCGYTNDLEKAVLNVHGVIFPSRMEGTPISLVDSLLCYRMAIVTPVGGMPEMVIDGQNGFVAKSIAAEGIDECLERAWQRRKEWKELGKKAGKMVREMVSEFPHKQCIKEIDKILS